MKTPQDELEDAAEDLLTVINAGLRWDPEVRVVGYNGLRYDFASAIQNLESAILGCKNERENRR
ncbi:MAG: hypothetical protein GY871_04335 [Actinomycetales bacterium]|nr:hypothetical protein [Actinomycetales bacterium]